MPSLTGWQKRDRNSGRKRIGSRGKCAPGQSKFGNILSFGVVFFNTSSGVCRKHPKIVLLLKTVCPCVLITHDLKFWHKPAA